MISFIWAQAKNGIIGNHGKIPWHEPADMHHFVKLTTHHIIVSGHTTFDSYGRKTGLPNRCNILISKRVKNAPKGVILFHDIKHFLAYANVHPWENIFICGGRTIYKELLPYVDRLYETIIEHNFQGDTRAVKINLHNYKLISLQKHSSTQKNPYPYTFKCYQKNL